MFRSKNYFLIIFITLFIGGITILVPNAIGQGNRKSNVIGKNEAIEKNEISRAVLAISPREINIGLVGPGESAAGIFTLKNISSGTLGWSTEGPENWNVVENEKLSNVIADDDNQMRIEIKTMLSEQPISDSKLKSPMYTVKMILQSGRSGLVCEKQMPPGAYREAIRVKSAGGQRTIFVSFKIVSTTDLPQINLNPLRMDMGCILPGKTISRKIMLTNKGREVLKWSVALQKLKKYDNAALFKKGQYLSFLNEEIRGSGTYILPGHLRGIAELNGKWAEVDGYPSGIESGNSAKIRFKGTGISLYLVRYPDEGGLTFYIDEQQIGERDWLVSKKEDGELSVIEGLPDNQHELTIVSKGAHLGLEGIKISGKDIVKGPKGWIAIYPNSGTTTEETDYINVNLNTAQLSPGLYSDNISVNSNGGDMIVEVFAEVISDNVNKSIDVYRFANGMDYLFTANPQVETKRLSQNSYVKEGIAFRLFVPETPGTKSFYRWFNPQKKDHFYHYDQRGGGKQLQGYIFEGSIGNIATSRLTNTRELYRWVNPASGHYFYTTDAKGEKAAKKGYRFDGIAGYVR